MFLADRIILSRIQNLVSSKNDIKLLEIEFYSDFTKINISSIEIYNIASTEAAKLIIPDNTEPVTLTSVVYNNPSFYIYLNLSTTVAPESHPYIRIKGVNKETWLGSYSISFFSVLYGTRFDSNIVECLDFPGENQFNSLPVFSENYLNPQNKWLHVSTPNRFEISNTGVGFFISSVSGGSTNNKIINEKVLTNGKWKFRVKDQVYLLLAFVSSNYIPNNVNELGTDIEGNSIAFRFNDSIIYKNSTNSQELRDLVIGTTNIPPITTTVPIKNSIQPIDQSYIFLVDADNGEVTLTNEDFNRSFTIKLPWTGSIGLVLQFLHGANYYSTEVNLGQSQRAFSNISKEFYPDYVYGWGEEFTVEKPKFPETFKIIEETSLTLLPQTAPTETRAELRIDNSLNLITNLPSPYELELLEKPDGFSLIDNQDTFILTEERGYGYIKSTVLKGLVNPIPLKTLVILYDIDSEQVAFTTKSDAETGEFEFKFISEWRSYNVLAFDPERGWVTAIGGPFRASRMPGYEGL